MTSSPFITFNRPDNLRCYGLQAAEPNLATACPLGDDTWLAPSEIRSSTSGCASRFAIDSVRDFPSWSRTRTKACVPKRVEPTSNSEIRMGVG